MAVPFPMIFPRLLLVTLLSVALLGCGGGGGTASAPLQTSGLKPLSVYYGKFLQQHRGMPPKDEAEFKQFLQSFAPETWKEFGFDNFDAMWNSSRDKQPYAVIYGTTAPGKLNDAPVVAYEKQGVGGKRYVANWNGDVQEIDDAKFKEIVPAPVP
jgi:hypothetical protein